MSAARLPLIVGVGEDGLLIPIRRAQRGLKCKCVCPACGARLSAKRGKIKAHHFAHYRVEECAGAVETALHRFAKAVLHHHPKIVLPPVYARGVKRAIEPVRRFAYRRTTEEAGVKGFVADVVLYGASRLIVELKVSHAVDPYKQRVFIRSGIRSVEIDVLAIFKELVQEHRAADTKELARRIINFGGREHGLDVHGHWLFHPAQHQAEYRRRQAAALLKVRHSEWKDRHHYRTIGCPCPERQRFTRGDNWQRAYAKTYQDCAGCPHLVELVHDFAWVGYQWVPVRLAGVRCGFASSNERLPIN
ncbi:competence protein CoiA family protein [Neolewinella persica]|uniref:competence protein CoiA family protein n=1 Tax=Neolewinella persica TaxID=70998 RepID=UPI00037B2231|nr:competence protein CoiA family protein [Neolewinella persica]